MERDIRQTLHYWTTVVYGLIGISLFMLPAAFSNYLITYQNLLLGTSWIPMTLLIGMNVSPGDGGYKQRRLRVILCISLFIAIAFAMYCSVTPFTYLVTKCPPLLDESVDPPLIPSYCPSWWTEGGGDDQCEEYFQYLYNYKICHNEYGFIIVYIIYMILLVLIHFITLFVYAFRMPHLL